MDTTVISRKTILNKEAIAELTDAVTDISSCRSIEQVADTTTAQLIKLLHAETCIFAKRSENSNTLSIIKICTKNGINTPENPDYSDFILKCARIEQIIKDNRIIQFHHNDPGLSKEDKACLEATNIKSLLLLPLFAKDKLNGLIGIGQVSCYRLFNERDILLGHLIASQSSAAMETAKLYQFVSQYSKELEAFHDIGLSMTSTLNLESVISSILRSSMRLFSNAQNSHIFLYENEKLFFISALWEDGIHHEPKAHPRPEGLTYTVARSGKLIIVPDMRDHPLYQNVPADWKGSIIGLPLKFGNRVVGVMTIAFTEPRDFTDAEHRILKMLGDQAAIAIENARLYERLSLNAHQLEALNQASLSLTSSLELDDVLNAIINSSFSFIEGLKDSHIFLYDGQNLSFRAGLMEDGTRLERPYAEPRKNGLTQTVARNGKPLIIEEMNNHPLYHDAPEKWSGAIIGLPLKIRERVVGVMTMACWESREFSEEDLKILRMLGDQAAIAIENANLHNMLNKQAHTDFLTNLPNRRSFEERLEDELRRSYRYKHRFVLAMMDLDGFKPINDTYGHPVGDQVLKQIAELLSSAVRDTDFLARVGGDEFALLMPETDIVTGRQVVQRIQKDLSRLELRYSDNDSGSLTISAGLSTYPIDENTPSGLFHIADQKLYDAKRILKESQDDHIV